MARRFRDGLLLLTVWPLIATNLFAESPSTLLVGSLNVIGRMEFTGELGFPEEELRSALALDAQFLAASHRSASRVSMMRVLRERLNAGYRTVGYPDPIVRIAIDPDDSRIRVHVEAGPRYICGAIEYRGLRKIPQSVLDEFLLLRHPPKNCMPNQKVVNGKETICWINSDEKEERLIDPLWVVDRGVIFHRHIYAEIASELTRAAALQGILEAKFDVTVRSETNGTATLVVTAIDEGFLATLGEIEIRGLTRHSREDILSCLKLEPGMPLTQFIPLQVEQTLRATGRFIDVKVEILGWTAAPARLRIFLSEADFLPRLNEPLTPEQQAAFRMAKWINQLTAGQDELEIEFYTDMAEWFSTDDHNAAQSALQPLNVFPPLRDALSRIHDRRPLRMVWDFANHQALMDVSLPDPFRLDLQLLIDPQRTTVVNRNDREQLITSTFDLGTVLIEAKTNLKVADDQGREKSMSYGVGWNSRRSDGLPIALSLSTTPGFVIRSLGESADSQLTEADGISRFQSSLMEIEMESATGRIIRADAVFDELGSVVRLRSTPGLIAAARKRLDEATATDFITRDSTREECEFEAFSLGVVRPLLVTYWMNGSADAARRGRLDNGLRTVQNILRQLPSPFARHGESEARGPRPDPFTIPAFDQPAGLNTLLPWLAKEALLRPTATHLGQTHWGHVIVRDVYLLLDPACPKKDQQAIMEHLVDEVANGTIGPLGALYAVSLVKHVSPQLERVLGRAGWQRFSQPRLREDFDRLLHPETDLGRPQLKFLQLLSNLNPRDLRDIADAFGPPELGSVVDEFMTLCQAHHSDLGSGVFRERFHSLLKASGVDEMIEQKLESYSDR